MEDAQDTVTYQSLSEKFEQTKKELGEANDTIRRITGRDPNMFPNGPPGNPKWKMQQQQQQQEGQGGRMPFPPGFRKRPFFPPVRSPEEGDVFEEDEDEVPPKRPSIQSTVVATSRDNRSRRDTIQEQNVKVKARNRRMFGMILGTLQKFQSEASKRKEQEKKRAEIEEKLEAAAAEEKERVKNEKRELFMTRKEKQIQLRCLEKKMEIAEMHDVWEKNQKHMINFIKLSTSPEVYFQPAKHNKKTGKVLEESKAKTLEMIQSKRTELETTLQDVEEWYKRDHFPMDKENMGPTEGEDYEESIEATFEPDTTTGLDNNSSVPNEIFETDTNTESLQKEDSMLVYEPDVSMEFEPDVAIHQHEDSNTQPDDEDDDNERTNEVNAPTLEQEFEPIYD